MLCVALLFAVFGSVCVAPAVTLRLIALATFQSIEARYQTARTLVALAELGHRDGAREEAAGRLREAHALFRVLRVPKYVAHCEALATAF